MPPVRRRPRSVAPGARSAGRGAVWLVAAVALLACGGTTGSTQTVATVPIGALPPAVTDDVDAAGDLRDGAYRTTVPLAPEDRLGRLVQGNHIILIGDSVMASTAARYSGEMCDALVPLGWRVEVNAEVGRFIGFGDVVLDARETAASWDIAAVALGANFAGDLAAYRDELTSLVERLAPRPVILYTVTEFEPSRLQVNSVIFEVAVSSPNVFVIDWGAVTGADPTLTGRDGLHLTLAGRERFASELAQVLGDAPTGDGSCLPSQFTDDSLGSVTGSNDPVDGSGSGSLDTTTSEARKGGGPPSTPAPGDTVEATTSSEP